jgi:outer membrane receptor for ferrienterochelin and colicins
MRSLTAILACLVVWALIRFPVAHAQAEPAQDAVFIPEVDVEAKREEAADDEPAGPRRTDQIDDEDIHRRSSWRLGEALQWLTSATPVDSTGTGSGLIVDGLPAAQVQVIEGGMPVSRPVGGPDGPSVNLDAISLLGRDIERVEVHRGLGPPGSGPAGGVVVQMHRRPAESGLGFSLQTAARNGATRLVDSSPELMLGAGRASYGADALDLQLRGSANTRRGVDVNDDGQFDRSDQRDYQFGARSEWRPSKASKDALVLDVSYHDVFTEGPYGQTSVLRDLVDTGQVVGRMSGEWHLSEGYSLEHTTQVDSYQHRFSKRVIESGFERLKADTGQLRVVQDVLGQKIVGRHLLGVEVYGSAERISRTGETGDLPEVDRLHAGLGLSDTWMPQESVEVSGRLWGDVHTDFTPGWMADLGVGWKASDRVELRVSGSRTRRLPTAEELFLFFDHSEVGYKVTGNPELRPENLWSGRAGVSFAPIDRLEIDAEVYYHRLDDLITTVQDTGSPDDSGAIPTFTYANINRAHTAGLRLGLAAKELVWGVDLKTSYTYLPLAENLDTGERLELRTRHQGLVEIQRGWFDERLETWVDARTRTALEVAETSPAAPAYVLLGAGVGWKPDNRFRVRLDADNLLNQTNATWGPKTGVSVLASIEYHYQSKGEE